MPNLKNIIITTIVLLLFGSLVGAQEPPIITLIKTKSRTYELYKAKRGFTNISDADYKGLYLTDAQYPYSQATEFLLPPRDRVLAILREELTTKNIDFGLLHKGKTVGISFVLNSSDRSIRTVSFYFSPDFIKDYKVIEKIDKRFRKELIFAPKKDEKYMNHVKSLTPIYYLGCSIPVDKL